MREKLKLALLTTAAVAVLAAAAAGAGFATTGTEKVKLAGGTLVFGTAADPVVLDGALVSDGESLRVIDQMFEGLIGLRPGTTRPEPALATSWKPSKNGLTWTFNLRKGVRFHDGTRFTSSAVCYNFNRWYGFRGSFQNPDATYYWQTVFGGFKHPEKGNPGPSKSLYRGCKTRGPYRVQLLLRKRSSSFFGALSLSNFAFGSPRAMKRYGANKGSVDENGVFHPTGKYGTRYPTGTGPFKFKSWVVGQKLTLVRNPRYWGKKAKLDRVIFQPISNNAARLQALQTGEINGYDLVAPQDIPTIKRNRRLKVLSRPAFNVAYVGINQAKPPMNKLAVRKAVAYGLNRRGVVRAFYAGRAVVAKEFMPPQVTGYAKKVTQYSYNPNRAKQLLRSAGLSLPVRVEFWYPTSVSRPYMPDPKKNFEAFKASLEQSGFEVVAKSAPWRPTYLSNVDRGEAQLYLLGWTGDYGDPDNFIGTFFQTPQSAWGTDKRPNRKIMRLLDRAEAETNLAKRTRLYVQANRAIMNWLPGVPYAHSSPALGFQRKVQGYRPSPVSLEPFSRVFFSGGR